MAVVSRMVKTKIYPRPHNMVHSWGHGLESAVVNQGTIYPILMNDEGLGTPSAYESNPKNAAFVEAAEPNCFPESRVDLVISELTLALTKPARALTAKPPAGLINLFDVGSSKIFCTA